MKVAMLTSTLDRSASEEGFIIDWVEAIARVVDALVVFTLKPQKSRLKAKNITVCSLSAQKGKVGKALLLFEQFRREHRKEPFTGIFSHMYDFLGISAGILGKVFKVKTIMWYAWGGDIKRRPTAAWALKVNDEVITCSKKMKTLYQSSYHLKQPIHVLGHAIETRHFSKIKRKENPVFTIGFAGRVSGYKNIETLLNAVGKAQVKRPISAHLALSRLKEHPEYMDKVNKVIRKLMKRNINVEILKDIPYRKMPHFYQSLDLYVHPGLIHSVDKAGLEAICSGTPVLLSQYGYQEVCAGYPQVLFDPRDQSELSRKIEQVVNHFNEFTKGQTALQMHVRQEYSTENFMKKLIRRFQPKVNE